MKGNTGQTIFVILFSLLFVFALFFRTSVAVIVEDLMLDFTIPAASLGLMSSAFFYGYAAMQLPVGFLSDRIGIRRTVLYFGLLGGLGSLLFAYASGVQTATWGRLLTGVGTAGIWIPALKYFSLHYRPHIFASLTSIISAAGCLGPMLATLPLAMLVEAKGWRYPFIMAAFLMVILVVTAWYLIGRTAGTGKDPSGEERGEQGEQPANSEKEQAPFWRHPVFWYFSLWAFFFYGAVFSFSTLWGAAYLQDTFMLSRETAGTHLLATTIGLLCGSLFWGVVSDRIVLARRPLLLAGTCSYFILWGILFGLESYPGSMLTFLLYFSLGFCGMAFILILSAAKEYFPLRTAGTAMGAVNALMLGGAAVFQGITGYILDLFQAGTIIPPYRAVFIFYLLSIAVALIFVILMPETFPGKRKKPPVSGKAIVYNGNPGPEGKSY